MKSNYSRAVRLLLAISLVASLLGAPTAVAGSCGWDQRAGWVARENARVGDSNWASGVPMRFGGDFSRRREVARVEGYFDRTSVGCGQKASLTIVGPQMVDILIYRIGYYKGAGARLVVSIKSATAFTPNAKTPPGQYLIKLISPGHSSTFIPIVVRSTLKRSDVTFVSSVLTWQSYNQWGGASLHKGADGTHGTRAESVSFDRPFDGDGAGQFRYMQQPLVQMMEQLGLDINYLTDIDVDEQPKIVSASLVFAGNSKYWTQSMRTTIEGAVNSGVNLLTFGASTGFAKIDLNGRVLSNRIPWRTSGNPESLLFGSQFFSLGIRKDLEVQADTRWPFKVLGKAAKIKGIYGYEADTAMGTIGPGIEILARATISPTEKGWVAMSTYYSAASGAGILNIGTNGWVCGLANRCPWAHRFDTATQDQIRLVTEAILKAAKRPQIGKWRMAQIDIPTRL